jgi:hypothetical protein
VPAIYAWREYVLAGGLMSYGTDLPESCREAAIYAGRILKGEKPTACPVRSHPRPSCARACRRVRMRGTLAISPRGKDACDEIMQKDAAGDDRGPERHLVVESF